jgi:hypothetical protein
MASRYGAGAGPDKCVVLIVARQAETRAALAQSLRSAGYAIELAEGFARAQNVTATTRIDFGLVVATAADDCGPGIIRVLERCAGGVAVAAARAEALDRLTNTGSFAVRSSIRRKLPLAFRKCREAKALASTARHTRRRRSHSRVSPSIPRGEVLRTRAERKLTARCAPLCT